MILPGILAARERPAGGDAQHRQPAIRSSQVKARASHIMEDA